MEESNDGDVLTSIKVENEIGKFVQSDKTDIGDTYGIGVAQGTDGGLTSYALKAGANFGDEPARQPVTSSTPVIPCCFLGIVLSAGEQQAGFHSVSS
nr:hypothetical protein [Candidatus Accumulibacter aalborgensis]